MAISDDKKAEICAAYGMGLPAYLIAELAGVAEGTVRRIARSGNAPEARLRHYTEVMENLARSKPDVFLNKCADKRWFVSVDHMRVDMNVEGNINTTGAVLEQLVKEIKEAVADTEADDTESAD